MPQDREGCKHPDAQVQMSRPTACEPELVQIIFSIDGAAPPLRRASTDRGPSPYCLRCQNAATATRNRREHDRTGVRGLTKHHVTCQICNPGRCWHLGELASELT